MKRILIMIAAVLMAVQAFAQDGKDIYNRYSGKEGVSAVYISPAMFNLMKSLPDVVVEDGEVNFSKIIKTFSGMYILNIEDGILAARLESEVSAMAEKGRYELLMEVSEESEKMRIYVVMDGDTVTDFLMIACEGTGVSVISISGRMPVDELQKLLLAS